MKNDKLILIVSVLFGLALSTSANATLIDRGNGMIYDSTQNITWLANANLAASDTFGVSGINSDGTMNWDTAQSWIGAMNAADYKGYNNWRLFSADPTCGTAFNCTTDELGSLYYNDLGLAVYQSITTSTSPDLTLFNNIQADYYWSGTEYAPYPDNAWTFTTRWGYQDLSNKIYSSYAWAVRSGDVASVPEPSILALMGIGFFGIGLFRRKKNQAKVAHQDLLPTIAANA